MSKFHVLGIALSLLLGSEAFGNAPKFDYAKKEEAEEALKKAEKEKNKTEWKASAQAGLLLTTGNSSATTLSSGFKSSRKQGKNKVQLELIGAYARSSIFLAADGDGDGAISANELNRLTDTTSKSWHAKTRYDRFLDERNALYISASISGDEPAGKSFVGSGQVGYSRTLIDTKVHEVTLEAGYDFSYEDLTGNTDALSIHSLRTFAGYEGKLSEDTSFLLSTEGLFNVNRVGEIDRFRDTRFNNDASLTTNVYGNLSFRFSFSAKYDNRPAPRPKIGLPYAEGFTPLADRLDTKTEATIIVNFL